jgi:hypothetical protein
MTRKPTGFQALSPQSIRQGGLAAGTTGSGAHGLGYLIRGQIGVRNPMHLQRAIGTRHRNIAPLSSA